MNTGITKKIFSRGTLAAVACLTGVRGLADASGAEGVPATLLMNGRILAESRQRIRAGDEQMRPAYTKLLREAESVMHAGVYSVMDKTMVPPGGDKHNYMSFSRYWWPDPDQPDGLPYIRRDGKTNPDSQGPASDRVRLDEMTSGVETLALAYWFTGEARYAEHAAELIRAWFLNPKTRMNPNLDFAQGVPGLVAGKKSGVLDGRLFCRVLDGVLLMADSGVLSASEQEALRAWFSRYLDWLKTGENAREEAESENNHGTFFDVQITCVALFIGEADYAKRIVRNAVQKRIKAQIKQDGSQPEELARTRSLFYSKFNLEALFHLARLAEHTGEDLWQAEKARIRTALDYIAPYADPAKPWPHPEVEKTERIELLQLLLYAAQVYQDESYLKLVEKLPDEKESRVEQLALLLMR